MPSVDKVEDLRSMKRNELQRLAKKHGVKANLKNEEIIVNLMKILPFRDLRKQQDEVDQERENLSSERCQVESDENILAPTAVEKSDPKQAQSADENENEENKKKRVLKRRTSYTVNDTGAKRSRRSSSISDREDDDVINEDLQEKILADIRKKIDLAASKDKIQNEKVPFSSQIPLPKFREAVTSTGKSRTPGSMHWTELHTKRFSKMESIDDYEHRKKERAERLLGSNKKSMQAISRLAQPVKRAQSKIVKPVMGGFRPKPSFMSPVTKRNTPGSKSVSRTHSAITKSEIRNKPKQATPFKPTITSVANTTFTFGEKASEKPILTRTTLTPFRVGPSSNTPVAKKKVFNLEESLKKPLTWVPHKGPLRSVNKKISKKIDYQEKVKNKQLNVTTRDKRRQKIAAEKKEVKSSRMMARRGIK